MVNSVNTITLILFSLMLGCSSLAIASYSIFMSRPRLAARWAGFCIGFACLMGLVLLVYLSESQKNLRYYVISVNALTALLCSLVLFISFIVHRFSFRYMDGDKLYQRFFLYISLLTLTAQLMILADNLCLFWSAWTASNLLLVRLMMHKKEWMAAKNSAILTFYSLGVGSFCLFISFVILRVTYSTTSISTLITLSNPGPLSPLRISIGLILVAAITQCGLFPFHRWVISSLNSPTPVSALMHAGLVNGGGILLVKFAPLMMLYPGFLTGLFIIGAVSAGLGSVWKLMQHDIKKMLAFSTLGQMGFMMMQCGLGLFAPAIAHLCLHGLFKAYLFLSSGSVLQNKRSAVRLSPITFNMAITSFIGGVAMIYSFILVTHQSISFYSTNVFVLFFAFIAGSQIMLIWLRSHTTASSFLSGAAMALFCGLIYGASIRLIQGLIPSISTGHELSFTLIHWLIIISFGVLWVLFNLGLDKAIGKSSWGCWLFMCLFNSSQPSRNTVTALRLDYKY